MRLSLVQPISEGETDISRFLPFLSKKNDPRRRILEKVSREAISGRRLAIYDQDSGLYANWYFERRFVEEAERCKRYGRTMSALLVETEIDASGRNANSVSAWLATKVRGCDFAGYLGEGRYALLMPETGAEGA